MLAVLAGSGGVAADLDPAAKPAESRGNPVWDPLATAAIRADAGLNDVSFVDPQNGWAVGDRGAIWHTEDGGRQWVLQQSGVSCRLESVSFVSPQVGWAAGWVSHPYLHTGAGVLLWTTDGGQHWSHDPRLLLPALKRVRFFNPRQGWAAGCPSAMYPSGVLVTESGGRGWNPVLGEKTPGWLAADFLGPQAGALADGRGGAAVVRREGIRPAEIPDLGLRSPARMKLTTPVGGWLVGQGGLILRTADEGAAWHAPPGDLSELAAGQYDFAAVEVRGPKCWIAGTPGTRVFHTPDAGRSWLALPTGQSLPLAAICFVDDEHGWAVGQLGTILATSDGGQSWRCQRAGAKRAALLGLFSGPDDVPFELFARLSGNEGYLGAVELLNRRDVELAAREEVSLADRAREALLCVGAAGATTAWQFPVRSVGLQSHSDQVVEVWDRLHDGRGLEALEAYLVRQIRTWRPEVIVTQDAAGGGDPVGHLLHQAVLRAASQAADPAAQPDQIVRVGLQPWQVRRVYSALPPEVQGEANVGGAQLADRLGRSLGNLASQARGLLDDRYRPGPQSLGFQTVFDQSPQPQGRHEFFGAVALPPGSEARRALAEPGSETLDLVRRLAQKQRLIHAILQRSGRDPRTSAALLAQADDLLGGLDPDSGTELLFHLAQTYQDTGQWPMAAEVYELLVKRYPGHPLVRAALVRLVQYYSSSEVARRMEGAPGAAIRQVAARSDLLEPSRSRLERAAALGQEIRQARPDLAAHPAVGFCLASVDRQGGEPRQAERFYAAQSMGTARDAWWSCARGEQWLASPRGGPPKPVLRCRAARGKPRLDGRLDDAVWKEVGPAELHSPLGDDAAWPAAVLAAHDGEFLYLAIRARQSPQATYEPTPGVRPRDADLSARDRVEWFFDTDRDYATFYHLSVDYRGWTAEDCWGDATWNPTWYVAAATGDGAWTVEAAIPLAELAAGPPGAGTAWAVGIQRIVPGAGFQSLGAPAAPEVIPEGFGYLVFDAGNTASE